MSSVWRRAFGVGAPQISITCRTAQRTVAPLTELIARRTLRTLLSDYKRSCQLINESLHRYREKFDR
jgi:hypothetical protein